MPYAALAGADTTAERTTNGRISQSLFTTHRLLAPAATRPSRGTHRGPCFRRSSRSRPVRARPARTLRAGAPTAPRAGAHARRPRADAAAPRAHAHQHRRL